MTRKVRQPKPIHVPVPRCPTCNVPWVLRLSMNLFAGSCEWLYQRDCKHKGQTPTGTDERAKLVVPDPYLHRAQREARKAAK
jgi:hypothetical protein